MQTTYLVDQIRNNICFIEDRTEDELPNQSDIDYMFKFAMNHVMLFFDIDDRFYNKYLKMKDSFREYFTLESVSDYDKIDEFLKKFAKKIIVKEYLNIKGPIINLYGKIHYRDKFRFKIFK